MTRNPITLKRTDTVKTALEIFTRHDISGCPVTDTKGKIRGVVTRTDVIRIIDVHSKVQKENMLPLILAAIKKEKYDNMKVAIRKILGMKVLEIMNKRVVVIDSSKDLYEATKLISRHDIERLPVVENKKLVGIVTKTDLIKVINNINN